MNRRKLGRLASTVTIHSARYHYTLNHFNHLLSVCVLAAIISLCYEILHLMRFGLMCHILVRCFYTSQSALTHAFDPIICRDYRIICSAAQYSPIQDEFKHKRRCNRPERELRNENIGHRFGSFRIKNSCL